MEQPLPVLTELPADVIALVPMRNIVLFPHVIMPVVVGRERSVAAIQHILQTKMPVGIVLQKDPAVEEPGLDTLCPIGTIANVVRHIAAEDGTHHAVCLGVERFRIMALVEGYPFLAARIERIPEATEQGSTRIEALSLQLRERAMEIVSLLPGVPAELAHALQATRAPSDLADITASLLDTEVAEKALEVADRIARRTSPRRLTSMLAMRGE